MSNGRSQRRIGPSHGSASRSWTATACGRMVGVRARGRPRHHARRHVATSASGRTGSASSSATRGRRPTAVSSGGRGRTSHDRGQTPVVAQVARVDLGLLELPRVVDVDRLPLGEDVERGLARLAVAVAGLLRAAEREMHLGADRARVDVGDARVEVAHRAERRVHVAGEDRRREAEADAVRRRATASSKSLDADQRGRRAEDLLLRDPHLRVDVAEDRRAVVEALVEPVARRDLAAGQQLRALVQADPRVRVDLLERRAR